MVFSIQKYVFDKRENYVEEFDLITKELVFKGEKIENKNEGNCYENNQDFIYEGWFLNGLKNGPGKMQLKKTGIFYEGNFVKDFPVIKANKMTAVLYQIKENKNKA